MRSQACICCDLKPRHAANQPHCCSFASLFNSEVNLGASLEAGHPLLVLAAGAVASAPAAANLGLGFGSRLGQPALHAIMQGGARGTEPPA